ncbi:TRAM/LAG1/CLN8 homology domain-containing protein, partial [Chytriomyces sp. MP71]
RVKFQTSTWRAFLYGISTILGIYIAMNESWSLDPKSYFEGYPHKTTFWLKLYYNIGFGNYAYQLINIFYEPKQSDFFQMVAHHCATVIVMLLSYVLGFTRAGVMILLLHDCSDPLMEIAKSFLYANRQAAADAFFALFATTFLITRDFIYPVYIVAPLFTYSKYEDGVQMPRGYGHYFYVIGACLYVLQALNVFWGCLIVKMVAKVLSSGSSAKGDIRDTEE